MISQFAPPLLAQTAGGPDPTAACGETPGVVCRWVFDLTGSEGTARAVEWVVAKPLKVLLVLLVAFVLNRVLQRAIRNLVERLVASREEEARSHDDEEDLAPRSVSLAQWAASRARGLAERAERGRQRAQGLGTVLRSIAGVVVYGMAALIVLGEFGVNLGPLIAGAGIAGIALGFGAQTLVRDFLSGLFMLAEDQYGVGDVVDLGDASGVVEEIRLRTTRLRDIGGTVWFVPNGEIRRVANKSQRWARAVLDVPVAYGADLDDAVRVIKEAADAIWHEQPDGATVIAEPEVLGVEALGDSAVSLRLALKVAPGEQFATARLARRRIKDALDAAGIEIPFAQHTVWLRSSLDPGHGERPGAAAR